MVIENKVRFVKPWEGFYVRYINMRLWGYYSFNVRENKTPPSNDYSSLITYDRMGYGRYSITNIMYLCVNVNISVLFIRLLIASFYIYKYLHCYKSHKCNILYQFQWEMYYDDIAKLLKTIKRYRDLFNETQKNINEENLHRSGLSSR